MSTASLVLGVAAAGATSTTLLVTGVAGLVAGAASMAAGEYISVSSQADTENADLDRERQELAADPKHELVEMTAIYISRGLDRQLASQVATQLMAHDALGAHARDELGISDISIARPIQAAVASAAAFTAGAAVPLIVVLSVPQSAVFWTIAGSSFLFLAALGALSAGIGGASLPMGAARVAGWGVFAMALTAGVGTLFGVAS